MQIPSTILLAEDNLDDAFLSNRMRSSIKTVRRPNRIRWLPHFRNAQGKVFFVAE
jgi:ribosomal protein L24E